MIEPGGTVSVTVDVETNGAVTFTGAENIRVQIRFEGTQTIAE